MATFLTVQNIKDAIITHKDNVWGASNEQIIEYCEFMNQYLYPKFANINKNDYLSNRIVKTIVWTSAYALPSDFQNLRMGAVMETETATDFGAINYDAETVAFTTTGQTITGGTSGATGTLSAIVDYGTTGTLILTSVSGTFQDNEVLTGATEGSATSNGTLIPYKYADNRELTETDFGSSQTGFWLDSSNINFTPSLTTSKVYVVRYLPELTPLSALSSSTIIPVRYREYARNAADIYWQQWKGSSNKEFEASQRTQSALDDMLSTITKTPKLLLLPNRTFAYRKRFINTRYTQN